MNTNLLQTTINNNHIIFYFNFKFRNINFNQVNKFHKNMIDRNKSYRIYCWGFPIIYTSIAIFIDNEQYIMSTSSTSDIGIINIWFSSMYNIY